MSNPGPQANYAYTAHYSGNGQVQHAISATAEVSNYVSADTVGFREPGKVPEIEWYARREWKTWLCHATQIQHDHIAVNSATRRAHYWSSNGDT